MTQFPLPEHRLPALAPLLQGDLWARWAAAERVFAVDDLRASIGYLRLKPETSCRLTVIASESGKGERPPQGFLLHLYPDLERARTAFAKLQRREAVIGEDGFEPFLDEEHATVAAPFPNDPELPSLRQVYDPTRFRRLLSKTRPPDYPQEEWRLQKRHIRTELLAYKPGRRAVFRVRVGVRHLERDEKVRLFWHLKVGKPVVTARNDATSRWIDAAVGGERDWRVPTPWGFSEHRSWISTEWVMGEPLGSDPATLERVGHALAEFHELPNEGHEEELSPSLSFTTEKESLISLGGDLAHLLPDDAEQINALAARLAGKIDRLAALPRTVVHGDFHHGQIVLEDCAAAETGLPRVVLVDLDNTGTGISLIDLGAFIANRIAIGRDPAEDAALLAGYSAVRPVGEEDLLHLATAHQLFRRAIFPFRTLDPQWPETMRARLNRVEELLPA